MQQASILPSLSLSSYFTTPLSLFYHPLSLHVQLLVSSQTDAHLQEKLASSLSKLS